MFSGAFRAPFVSPLASAGAAATPWYLAGGVALANVVAAYQPIGAASLAASYSNLANPGTNNAAPGVAPTHASATGWTFNGTTQYLSTPNPASGYSVVIRLSNAPTAGNNHYAFASYAGTGNTYFRIIVRDAGRCIYNNGGTTLLDTEAASAAAVWGMTPTDAYKDGVSQGSVGGWSGTNSRPVFIAARNLDGTADAFTAFNCLAYALYNTALTGTQMSAIMTAAAALTG